jgi:hypothetical protein
MPPRPLTATLSLFAPLLLVALGSAMAAVPAPTPPPQPTRGLVIVLRPTNVDELTRTALTRVTGELAAARFRIIIVPLDPNQDPTPQVETAAPELQPVAAFAIAHMNDSNGDTIAIWVSDRLGRRTTIQRMVMRGTDVSQDAEVLALEAIELIRVSIAGLWPTPVRSPVVEQPSTVNGATSTTPVAPPARDQPVVSLGLGAAMLQDVGVRSPQWMGALTGLIIWPNGLAARAQLTGLGPAMTVSGDAGAASVHRELASVGLGWDLWREERVQALLLVALGAAHVSATGSPMDPTSRVHDVSAWAAMGLIGVGARARLTDTFSMTADVDGVMTAPSLILQIGETKTASFSRPGVLLHVGLQADF